MENGWGSLRVKVKRHITRKSGKEYTTYMVVIPKDLAEALGLSVVDEVEMELKVVDGKIAIVITKP
ncbi:MAG: AbrB/MazE/SpoVT family DNA-binding domain-containing protein [Thermofilaceae archaeon]